MRTAERSIVDAHSSERFATAEPVVLKPSVRLFRREYLLSAQGAQAIFACVVSPPIRRGTVISSLRVSCVPWTCSVYQEHASRKRQ